MRILQLILVLLSAGSAGERLAIDTVVIAGALSVPAPESLFAVFGNDSLTVEGVVERFEAFKRAYQQKAVLSCGFLLDTAVDRDRGSLRVLLTVTEGEWVKSIAFSGATEFPADTLRRLLAHRPGGPFHAESLSADVARLKSFFTAKGFSAEVDASSAGGREKRIAFQLQALHRAGIVRFRGARHFSQETLLGRWNAGPPLPPAARLARILKDYHSEGFFECRLVPGEGAVAVEEGPRSTIARVEIEGNRRFPADSLLFQAQIKAREWFSEPRVKSLVDRLLVFYENNGFPFCEIRITGISAESSSVVVRLSVSENGRYVFGSFTARGARATRAAVVERLSGLRAGDLFRETALSRARDRLVRSGLFERVDPPTFTLGKNRRVADVHVALLEGPHNSAEGMAGISPEAGGPRWSGFFDLSLGNMGGSFRKLDLHYQKERPLTASDVRYREPWMLNSPLGGEASFSFRLDELQYTLWEWGLKFDLPAGDHLLVYTGFTRRAISFARNAAGDSLGVTEQLTGTQAGVTADFRDFPENPRRGFWADLPLQYGYKTGGGENFSELRTGVRVNGFVPLGGRRVLFFGSDYRTLLTPDTALNKGELYPLGGTASLRGYRENQFYASTVLTATAEIRLITGLKSRVALFADGGVVDASSRFKNVRLSRDILLGYGLGLRLSTRAGQFGADYGVGRDDSPWAGKIHVRVKNQF